MYQSKMARLAGPTCLLAAALLVVAQAIGLFAIDPDDLGAAVNDPLVVANGALALVACGAIMAALIGLSLRLEAAGAGSFGFLAFLIALPGTVLLAGDFWFEAFAFHWIGDRAPELLDEQPDGVLLAGAVTSFTVFALGWFLIAVACLRAQLVSRPAALLLAVGGLAGWLAATPPMGIPLAVALGWVGWQLIGSGRAGVQAAPLVPSGEALHVSS